MQRPIKIRLTSSAERAVRSGSPWIFAASVLQQSHPGAPGDLAAVYNRANRLLCLALFDPFSPIRLRVIHRGAPVTVTEDWWQQRLTASFAKRSHFNQALTNGYRLVHGENDDFPGFVLDRYADTLVLKLYTAAWLPHLSWILNRIQTACPEADRLVLRLSRHLSELPFAKNYPANATCLIGTPPSQPILFRENGLRFEADVLRGQKTGFFLDQRENRERVQSLAQDAAVLNVFSYSSAFSLYAAAGGAREVQDVDLSAAALAAGDRHFQLNQHQPNIRHCRRTTLQADAFQWLRSAARSRTFDLVILDPPALAKKKADIPQALRAYRQLAAAGAALTRPGGIFVTASCSAHVSASDFIAAALDGAQQHRQVNVLEQTSQPGDHPANIPESAYLKCLYLQIQPKNSRSSRQKKQA